MNRIEIDISQQKVSVNPVVLVVMRTAMSISEPVYNPLQLPAPRAESVVVRKRATSPDKKIVNLNSMTDEEIAKAVIENWNIGDDLARTTSYKMKSKNGVADVEINPNYDPHAEAEYEATRNEYALVDKGYDLLFWISAKDAYYPEGRLNIVRGNKIGDDYDMDAEALVIQWSQEQCLSLGKLLLQQGGKSMEGVTDIESLRCQPIGFRLEEKKWLEKCRELMPEMEDVWKFLENKAMVGHEREALRAVKIAREESKGNQKVFYQVLRREGFPVRAAGNHGVGGVSGIESYRMRMVGNEVYVTPTKKENGKYFCPLCGAEVKSNETICSQCKVKIDWSS